jgi:hypothetical protein
MSHDDDPESFISNADRAREWRRKRQESFEEKQRRAGAWICLRDIAEWRSELHASVCIEKPQICDQVVFVVRGKRIGGRRYIGDHGITLCHIGLLR